MDEKFLREHYRDQKVYIDSAYEKFKSQNRLIVVPYHVSRFQKELCILCDLWIKYLRRAVYEFAKIRMLYFQLQT